MKRSILLMLAANFFAWGAFWALQGIASIPTCGQYLATHPEIDPRGFTCENVGPLLAPIVLIVALVGFGASALKIAELTGVRWPQPA